MKINFILLFLLSSLVLFGQTTTKEIAVIQNKTGFIKGRLKEVQTVFQGKYTRWPVSGESVTIVLPSSKNPSSINIANVIYKSSVKDMQKFWLALVFQGRAAPPVFLETDTEIIQFVQKNPGAIGVISSGSRKGIDDLYLFQFIE